MRYVLGGPPRTQSEAFDALESVFGGEEFSEREAQTVFEEALDMSFDEARNELGRLLRSGVVEEA